MLLADRGFAKHELMGWLQANRWHYCFRLPCDVLLHGASQYPKLVGSFDPPVGEARLYRQVRWGQMGFITAILSWQPLGASRASEQSSPTSRPPYKPCGESPILNQRLQLTHIFGWCQFCNFQSRVARE